MEKKGKLLIVEDNPEILQALQFFLEYEFQLITSLSNPNLIPSTLRAEQFDIVLLEQQRLQFAIHHKFQI
jgi:DNA-binding response OmpR family regulator